MNVKIDKIICVPCTVVYHVFLYIGCNFINRVSHTMYRVNAYIKRYMVHRILVSTNAVFNGTPNVKIGNFILRVVFSELSSALDCGLKTRAKNAEKLSITQRKTG